MSEINPHRAMLKEKLRETVLRRGGHRTNARRLSDSLRIALDYNLRESVQDLDAEAIDRDTRLILNELVELEQCEQRIRSIEGELYG